MILSHREVERRKGERRLEEEKERNLEIDWMVTMNNV